MGTKRVPRSRLLEWFLEFLNLDLGRISMGERAKWSVEIEEMLAGRFDLDELEPKAPSVSRAIADRIELSSLDRIDLELYQKELKKFFASMISKIESTRDSLGRGYIPEEDFDHNPSLNCLAVRNITVELRAMIPHWDIETETDSKGKNRQLFRLGPESISDTTISLSFSTHTNVDALLFRFCLALEDAPINSFRKCQECGRWFIHLSRREKHFCSNPCASRYGVRKKRQSIKEEGPGA